MPQKIKAVVAPGRTIVMHEPPPEMVANSKKSGVPVPFDYAHTRQYGPGAILDLDPLDAKRFGALGFLVADGGQAPVGGSGPPVVIEANQQGPR